ncbi:MAG: hypothetical protein CVT80_00425 [Alphaproteobacteria bacterium HGW-Alphaproteobacteria-2]|nr:MAG: hypothetical protein CVT80_00425 [Alphaproteobacteria bacterium HGW-Alphaproteobacteria-2]
MSEAGFAPARPGHDAAETLRDAIMERAARAVGRIDAQGIRAITGLSVIEIDAMATALLMLGLVPVPPGGRWPPDRTTQQKGGE